MASILTMEVQFCGAKMNRHLTTFCCGIQLIAETLCHQVIEPEATPYEDSHFSILS